MGIVYTEIGISPSYSYSNFILYKHKETGYPI